MRKTKIPSAGYTFSKMTSADLRRVSGASSTSQKCRGSILHISKGSTLRKPVEVTIKDPYSALFIFAEEKSSSVIRLRLSSKGKGASHATKVHLAESSHLTLITLDESSGGAITQECSIEKGARAQWICASFGKGKVMHNFRSEMPTRGSTCDVRWLFSANGEDHFHLSARLDLAGAKNRGTVDMRGIAAGKAHVTCDGSVSVQRTAKGSQGHLTQRALMLGEKADIRMVPKLAVHTRDTEASHSASALRITDDALFYLQSRGIPPAKAWRMYAEGFLREALMGLEDEKTREGILRGLTGKVK